MAKTSDEAFLTLSQAARKNPSGRVAAPTVWRWTTAGVLARNGQRVRLKSYRFGRALRIKQSDLLVFAEELASANAAGFAPSAA